MASRTQLYTFLLALAALTGCASSSKAPAGATEEAAAARAAGATDTTDASDPDADTVDGVCVPEVTVTVAIVNRSSYDIEVYFDGYRAGRTAEGFTRTTYQVPRYRLHRTVTLNILRGGLQIGGPAYIPVEQVYCNDATILVGARPKQSVFYGDKLYAPERSIDRDGGEADGSPPEEGESAEGEPEEGAG